MKVKINRSARDGWVDSWVESVTVKLSDGNLFKITDLSNIKFNTEGSESSQKPRYSKKIDGKWYGLDENLNRLTKGYRTHKELKNDWNVVGVKGLDIDEGKVYGLIMEPDEDK